MKTNKNSELNKGFTLVELIVSMAIMIIVALAIIAFFSMSMRQYRANTNETNVQTESQLAWKRLESNILITSDGLWTPNENEIDLYNYNEDGTYPMTLTRIYFTPNSPRQENKDNYIYYMEYGLDSDGTRTAITSESDPPVFASFVTAFTVKLYDKDGVEITDPTLGTRPVKAEVHIEYESNERTYESDNTVAIRNTLVASNDTSLIYGSN